MNEAAPRTIGDVDGTGTAFSGIVPVLFRIEIVRTVEW